MIVSSWRNAALASLMATVPATSGQRILIVPRAIGLGSGAEPPCRQRRLAPWRRQVRERCLSEAVDHCRGRDAFAWTTASSPLFGEVDSAMDSMFRELFARPPVGAPREGERDPLDSVFDGMLGFALRAFDEMKALDDAPPAAVAGGGEDMEEAGKAGGDEGEEEVLPLKKMEGGPFPWEAEGEEPEDFDSGYEKESIPRENAFWEDETFTPLEKAEEVPAPPSSEAEGGESALGGDGGEEARAPSSWEARAAAEEALDAMVASLARRSASEDEAAVPLDRLPQRLFQLGNDLLAEAQSRRRLSEAGEGAVDPRLQVKERLARRLTEYRDDLVFNPTGTVTLYTTSSFFPPSLFAPPPSAGVSYAPPLGMGSDAVDECIRSRYSNGELEQSCRRAVGELLEAVDDRDKVPPVPIKETIRGNEASHPGSGYHRINNPHVLVFVFSVLALAPLVFSLFVLLDTCSEEGDYEGGEFDYAKIEDEEEDSGDEGNEFDYAELPEVVSGENREGRGPRAFMGVPVQVV